MRTNTVKQLAALLDEKRVVHVRGTPSSGKTTLAHLLKDHYIKRKERVVYINGWHNTKEKIVPAAHFLAANYTPVMELHGYDRIDPDTLIHHNIIFLIDEAQHSYRDEDFWLGIIKTQSGRWSGIRICLFSAYGSPAAGSDNYSYGNTPVQFGPHQRVSITISRLLYAPQFSLFYNPEEFQDVVKKFCSNPTMPFMLNSAACDYLYSITSGHPGAVKALLTFFFEVYINYINYNIYWQNKRTNNMNLDLPFCPQP
jgi:hypothetical protein